MFACEEDFENSENQGFLLLDNGSVRIRIDGKATVRTNNSQILKSASGTAITMDLSNIANTAEIWDLVQAISQKKYMFLCGKE